jgi:uncharacterized membrane protein YjjP (DUF1212 family)
MEEVNLSESIKLKSFPLRGSTANSHQLTDSISLATPTTKHEKLMLQKLIARLAKVLFVHGAPSYSVENRIQAIAKAGDIELGVMVNPNHIFLTFGDFDKLDDDELDKDKVVSGFSAASAGQTTVFIKCKQIYNMERLHDADYLAKQIAQWHVFQRELAIQDNASEIFDDAASSILVNNGTFFQRNSRRFWQAVQVFVEHFRRPVVPVGFQEALHLLQEISSTENQYSLPIRCLANATMSASTSLLVFNGGIYDGTASFCLGILTMSLIQLATKYERNTMELWIPCIISIISNVLSYIFDSHLCLGSTLLPSILPFYPGVAITTAMMELAAESLNSGSVRIFYSFVSCLKLGFGLSIGSRLFKWMVRDTLDRDCTFAGHSNLYTSLLIIPFSAAACVSLRGNFARQFPIMLIVSILGYAVMQISLMKFSKDISSFLSAFAIGLASNVYARITNDIAIASSLAGILLIVPVNLYISVQCFHNICRDLLVLWGFTQCWQTSFL